MSGFSRIRRHFTWRNTVIALGILSVLALVWFGGPLIAIAGWSPLEGVAARLLFLLLLFTGCLLYWLWRGRRDRQSNEKVVNEMITTNHDDELLKEELETQRDRLRQALALARKWKPGRLGSVYDLPWYMIIGAPGSGKSTALLNSGLEFPLKEQMGIDAIQGVGGTRYCDWWFTNRAVIIDTAGRYTTQESGDRRDARGWNAFLGLLRKHRSRQPINGVILAISLADLLEQTPTERLLQARALKQRVQELKNRLGVVFPVYVMLTKLDLLDGFGASFRMLSETERQDVLGMTFELEAVQDAQTLPATFEAEFDGLLERLNRFSLHRLQQERSADSQRRIYQFPKQVALLRAPLWSMLKEVFFPSAYEDIPLLRGIYLVSSEQAGKTIDKVSSLVDQEFQLRGTAPAAATPSREGFFLRRLFEQIVFSERGLASADGEHQKRHLWVRRSALAAGVLVSAVVLGSWGWSYQLNKALAGEFQAGLETLQELQSPQSDWIQVERLLSRARSLPGVGETPLPQGGFRELGLYQGEVLSHTAQGAYGRLLREAFGARLKANLETEIRQNLDNLEYLYETLKVYLMLNQPEHLDPDPVYAWFSFVLDRQLPGNLNAEARKALSAHLEAYLQRGYTLSADQELVASAQRELTDIPLAERAYQRIKLDASFAPLPPFRLSMALGSVAERVFTRRSGAPLDEGVPGFFTYSGYEGIFLPERDKIVKRLLEDAWVYGESASRFQDLDEAQLRAAVEDRYYRDYVHAWRSFLQDLRIRRFSRTDEGARIAMELAGPEAPVERLVEAVSHNTRLTKPEKAGNEMAGKAAEKAGELAARRSRAISTLRALAPTAAGGPGPKPTPVDQAFAPLHKLAPDTFSAVRQNAEVIGRYLRQMASPGKAQGQALSRGDFDQAVRQLADRLGKAAPETLEPMMVGLVEDARGVVTRSTEQRINSIWKSTVYREYRQAIAGRFPVDPEAEDAMAIDDFEAFFGPGGRLDRFFDEHLAPHVNTRVSPWRLTRNVGVRRSTLALFEHLEDVRRALFPAGSGDARVRFSLKPRALDKQLARLEILLGGQNLVYRHGPQRPTEMVWPAPSGDTGARLILGLASGGQALDRHYEGDWSLFRLLAESEIQAGDARVRHLVLKQGGYEAELELTAGSVHHPFSPTFFSRLKLPARL